MNTATFKGVRHGYTVTAHKSQGMTVDRAFVLVDSKMFNREMLYVALSRSRSFSQLVANKDILGELSDEAKAHLRSVPKASYASEHEKALESGLAKMLARSGIRDTTQTGRKKEDILKLSPRDKLDQLLWQLEKRQKKAVKVAEKVADLAAKKGKQKLGRMVKRSLTKV